MFQLMPRKERLPKKPKSALLWARTGKVAGKRRRRGRSRVDHLEVSNGKSKKD
jgi:hypothetical protein